MGIDIQKVNSLLKSENFVEKLISNLSNEGIIKIFGDEVIKLEIKDAQDFKKVISGLYEISDDSINVSGGKISFEIGTKDIGKGIGGSCWRCC